MRHPCRTRSRKPTPTDPSTLHRLARKEQSQLQALASAAPASAPRSQSNHRGKSNCADPNAANRRAGINDRVCVCVCVCVFLFAFVSSSLASGCGSARKLTRTPAKWVSKRRCCVRSQPAIPGCGEWMHRPSLLARLPSALQLSQSTVQGIAPAFPMRPSQLSAGRCGWVCRTVCGMDAALRAYMDVLAAGPADPPTPVRTLERHSVRFGFGFGFGVGFGSALAWSPPSTLSASCQPPAHAKSAPQARFSPHPHHPDKLSAH